MNRLETDELAELIIRKHQVLNNVRELSRRQADVIGETNQLLTLLNAKQTLLAELQKIEQQLDRFRGQDPDSRVWRTQEERLRIRKIAENCNSLLQETLLLEKQSESLLTSHRNETAVRLEGAHSATLARKAYRREASDRRTAGGGQLDLTAD